MDAKQQSSRWRNPISHIKQPKSSRTTERKTKSLIYSQAPKNLLPTIRLVRVQNVVLLGGFLLSFSIAVSSLYIHPTSKRFLTLQWSWIRRPGFACFFISNSSLSWVAATSSCPRRQATGNRWGRHCCICCLRDRPEPPAPLPRHVSAPPAQTAAAEGQSGRAGLKSIHFGMDRCWTRKLARCRM